MDEPLVLLGGFIIGLVFTVGLIFKQDCVVTVHDTSAGIYVDYKKDLYKLEKVMDKGITK